MKKYLLDVMPKKAITLVMGKITKSNASKVFIKPYIKMYGINIKEVEKNIEEYKNLNEFFTRKLKEEERKIENADIVSPSDGFIKEKGTIRNGKVFQIKGDEYELKSLLRSEEKAKELEEGSYVNIYLSPKDYHRIHSPINGRIKKCEHIEGKLYPVNDNGIENIKGLYTKNERVNVYIENDNYEIILSNVGALIVGSVKLAFCELGNNEKRDMDIEVSQGQEIGMFEFGSTVVLLVKMKNKKEEMKINKKEGIKMGEKIL